MGIWQNKHFDHFEIELDKINILAIPLGKSFAFEIELTVIHAISHAWHKGWATL